MSNCCQPIILLIVLVAADAHYMNQFQGGCCGALEQQCGALAARVEALARELRALRRAAMPEWNATTSVGECAECGDHSLFKLFAEPKSWEEAQMACRALGAHLVQVDSDRRNAFVKQLLVEQLGHAEEPTHPDDEEHSGSGAGPEAWLGVRTRAMLTAPVRYANFDAADTNRAIGEGCAVMDRRGKWRIRACANQRPYVCQMEGLI